MRDNAIKLIGIAVAVIVLAVVGVGGAVYFGIVSVPWGSTPAEHSARYYPDDVLVYSWLTLNPSMGQRQEMMDIWGRFDDMRSFRNWVDDFEDDLDDETGADFDDVLNWVGDEFSAAILDIDIDDGEVEAAATIAVRNRDDAADFLADWLDYWEDEQSADFDRDSINGYDVWVDEYSLQAYALTEDLLVFATTEDALEEVLDRVAGEQNETLASDEDFIEARAVLPDRRFASVYVDYRQVSDVLEDDLFGGSLRLAVAGGLSGVVSPLMDSAEDACAGKLFETPDWMMASAAWVDRGVVFDLVAPAASDLWPGSSDLVDGADLLPEDTLGFLSVSFDPDVDNWREALRQCEMADLIPDWEDMLKEINRAIPDLMDATNLLDRPEADEVPAFGSNSTLADALDIGLWIVDQLIGIHLEEDLFDYLGGDLVMAVHDVDFEGALSSKPTGNLVDGVLMLSYLPDGEEGLEETVNNLVGRLESLIGQAPEQVDVGAENDARVFDFDGQQLQPGYVLHDGYLTIGTTRKSLETTVARQKSDGDRLSAAEEYQRTIAYLPDGRQFLMYVDLQRIMSELDPDELDMDEDLYEVLSDGLSAMAMSVSIGDAYSRVTFVLSLLPGK